MDKSLSIAFLISTIFHIAIFLPLPHINHSSVKKVPPSLKITYLAPKEISLRKTPGKDTPHTAVKPKAQKKKLVAKFKVDSNLKPQDISVKKMVSVPQPLTGHPEIEIPPELPREKEALYLNYYQSIREEIKRYVINNYPRYIACGEVCLYFVLLSNGKLKEINVVEERSSQNRRLKEIAKRSIQQASPFFPFPVDLDQPQLSFNVIISFELEN